VNSVLLYPQVFVYFPFIIWYIGKRKKFLRNNFADSDYLNIKWIQGVVIVGFVLCSGVAIVYMVSAYDALWINPLLGVAGMTYLLYTAIRHSTFAYINRLPDIPADTHVAEIAAEPPETVAEPQAEPQPNGKTAAPTMSSEQMKEICDTVTEYLKTSEAYKNCDLVLNHVSHETGIYHRTISAAINGYLHRNFFELVNGMRVEEAKRLLQQLSASDFTIESVASESGFRSRSNFFAVFKKVEGKTPLQWLKDNG
jgi:AraC-like DNA-binding protein